MDGIWKYQNLLPRFRDDAKRTLGEGNTPLVKSAQLSELLGLENLYFKLEIVNPSGSYKDRFAVCAIADLIQRNVNFCIASSSGNTGAALSAYCASAGIPLYICIVDGAPAGKVQQMQAYGAKTLMVKKFGLDAEVTDEVVAGLNAIAEASGSPLQISAYEHCAVAMAGVQTISYEIAEEIPTFDGHVFSPAGGGGLTLAIAKGFNQWKDVYPAFKVPKVHCVQPLGNDTIATPLRSGLPKAERVAHSVTAISGLQVPSVLDGNETLLACRASGGTGYVVADEQVYECQKLLAKKAGIFCEPAGAVALAGLMNALKDGQIGKDDHVVCLVTGHGFKDPVSAAEMAGILGGNYFETAEDTIAFIERAVNKIIN